MPIQRIPRYNLLLAVTRIFREFSKKEGLGQTHRRKAPRLREPQKFPRKMVAIADAINQVIKQGKRKFPRNFSQKKVKTVKKSW
jgi:hypothetical protein